MGGGLTSLACRFPYNKCISCSIAPIHKKECVKQTSHLLQQKPTWRDTLLLISWTSLENINNTYKNSKYTVICWDFADLITLHLYDSLRLNNMQLVGTLKSTEFAHNYLASYVTRFVKWSSTHIQFTNYDDS